MLSGLVSSNHSRHTC